MEKLYVEKMFEDVKTPFKATPEASGFDVYAYRFNRIYRNFGGNGETVIQVEDMINKEVRDGVLQLNYLERVLVGTGLKLTLNAPGYEIQARPRSGLALKNGLTVLNTPGTIDNDYRGELGIIIVNLSRKTQLIPLGERIAQIVPAAVALPEIVVVDNLPEPATDRKEGGFGSSGTK